MKIYHWWPGRTWAGPCPIPEEYVKEAERMGSKYLTVAKATVAWGKRTIDVLAAAYCNPKDVPDRRRGRHIAAARLDKEVNALCSGYTP